MQLNLHLQPHEILNYLIFMYFVSFGTHIFGDKTLQLAVHLTKLIMNR